MSREIERKLRVQADDWRPLAMSRRSLKQVYLSVTGNCSVRIRIERGVGARLTVKSAEHGVTRSEYEYQIPVPDAEEMTAFAVGTVIEKVRHVVPFANLKWEVDEFLDKNVGLVIAEVELETEDQDFKIPDWVSEEVTNDHRFYNASLAERPYTSW